MQHICYLYIYDYRCLHNVDLLLDQHYDIHFDNKSKTLSIRKDESIPQNFWGDGVWSVASIIGNNGAGKTTVIRFLLDAIIEGASTSSINGIIVYESNGTLFVYHHNNEDDNCQIIINCDKIQILCKTTKLPRIETFFYMGHFSLEFSYSDLITVGLKGLYNASEGYCLRNDIEKFANMSDSHLTHPFFTYLVSHISQNNYRICRLLINDRLKTCFHSFDFPKYLFFAPNCSGQYNLRIKNNIPSQVGPYIGLPVGMRFKDQLNQVVGEFIHHNLLNAMSESYLLGYNNTIVSQWYEDLDTTKDVLPQFLKFVNKYEQSTYSILFTIYSVLEKLINLSHFNELTGTFYLEFNEDKAAVKGLMKNVLSNQMYLTSRFFDMYYGQDINNTSCSLSSGEQVMLNLFSRIYDAIELNPQKFSNINSPSLLLLDEAELGLHPEWQRTYMQTLLDFLQALYVVAGFNYQVVITSHSPILLSDIPKQCCNFLKKDENGVTKNVRLEQSETYASNVFDLYRNSFFLDKGLIGSFAEKRLMLLKNNLQNGGEDVEKEISLIGDKHLRMYFEMELQQQNKQSAIQYHKQRLKDLGEPIV